MKTYVCDVCGWVYDEAAGDPDNGIAPGTKFGRCTGRMGLPSLRCRQGSVL